MKLTWLATFTLIGLGTMVTATAHNASGQPQNRNFVLKIHHSQCPDCDFSEATIAADGRYTFVATYHKVDGKQVVKTAQGNLRSQDMSIIEFIQQQIPKTNFKTIKSKPARGCVTILDGTEATYTFVTQDGVEVIPDCTYDIAPKSSLFTQADRLFEQIGLRSIKQIRP
jgi:hypothetical protein